MTDRLGVEEIVALFSARTSFAVTTEFHVVKTVQAGPVVVHLAVNRSGLPALLVPVPNGPVDVARVNHGVSLRSAPLTEFNSTVETWREPAAVLECRDGRLTQSFAGMVASVVARVGSQGSATWDSIACMYGEWERLFSERRVLGPETALGLWGELWMLATSTRDLVNCWLGPDGESVDLVVDKRGFEVKTGRRPNSHLVSQAQIGAPLGETPSFLVSIHVVIDPLRGCGLDEMVRRTAARSTDLAAFEEKLAGLGYSRDDSDAYGRAYSIATQPRIYAAPSIPRVRSADQGVSNLRYRVDLDPAIALAGEELAVLEVALGIPLSNMDYPCA